MTNIINTWSGSCGCVEKITECNTVIKKVDEVPSLGDATRNHVYLLPDNTAWIVNSYGTGFSQLNSSGAGEAYDDSEIRLSIQDLIEFAQNVDSRVLDIERKNDVQDEDITALKNRPSAGEAYDDTAIKERLEALEDKTDNDTTYTAGDGISISADNVISATGGSGSTAVAPIKDTTTDKEVGHISLQAITSDFGIFTYTITQQPSETLGFLSSAFTGEVAVTPEATEVLKITKDITAEYNSGSFYVDQVPENELEQPKIYFGSFIVPIAI